MSNLFLLFHQFYNIPMSHLNAFKMIPHFNEIPTKHDIKTKCIYAISNTYVDQLIQDFFLTFSIKMVWSLQILGDLRTLSLKFQKARTKIEVFLSLPCWLSQLNWDSQEGRVRTTSNLVWAFWNLNLRSSNNPKAVAFTIPWYLEV